MIAFALYGPDDPGCARTPAFTSLALVGPNGPKRSNREARRCTRYVLLSGSFGHQGQAGANSFVFPGRLRGRRLAPGRYRLRGEATNSAGSTSALKRIPFRIVLR